MTEVSSLPPRKLTGLAHLQAALGYSLGGATRLTKEAAFRQEILSYAAALLLFAA
ncbi:hypothetical protein [Sinorhizobium sp. BG8]|uniref:hypothetical protein n=1 Tax=Sinorhizobium sp. BG8 TaxID=2613773 RepID=UPI0032B21C42